jgi:hypothetical protein
MASDVNDLKEALEAAASEEEVAEESSTEANAEAATEEDADKSKPKPGKNANSRIQELVAARKKIEADFAAAQADLKKKDSEMGDLLKMLQQKESDSRTVQAIKDLHARNDKWRDTIERLDKALKGEEVEIESEKPVDAKDKPEAAELAKVRDLLSKSQAELEEKVAEQRANLILDKVDRIVDRYMDNLPEGYGKEDRRILQETLSDHIDWNSINKSPDDVQKHVVAGLQKVITWYGRPKGEAPAPSKDAPNGASVTQPTDPKVELDGLLKRTDYGKAKIVETKEGGKRFEAAVSDDQFVADLAKALRAARAANLR